MIESTLFGIIFGHQRRRILILKPSEYKVDNDSSAKVGGGGGKPPPTTNKKKRRVHRQAEGEVVESCKIPSSNI